MPPAAAEVAGADGYWGIPTATIDWCEENYEVRENVRSLGACGSVKVEKLAFEVRARDTSHMIDMTEFISTFTFVKATRDW